MAQIGDFVPELRGFFGPQYMANLEKLVAIAPNSAKRIEMMKARFKSMAEQRAKK